MKLKQHLRIGNMVLSENEAGDFRINKNAYLLGCIAPDLNCIYPAHRLKTTDERFYRRLKRFEKSSTSVVKSFVLGIITHYICDYFCYAHNIESLGVNHKHYETNLYKYYLAHNEEIKDNTNELLGSWVTYKDKSRDKYVKDNCMTVDNHCEIILSQIKFMNSKYLSGANMSKKGNWSNDFEQMHKDLMYTLFMVEHILNITVEPFKCLVGQF